MWRRLAFLALVLAACRTGRVPSGKALPDAETRKHWLPRTLFERVRELGGFTLDAWVVWTPLWPSPKDELLVLYDLEAAEAPLHGAKQLEWVLQPEEGPPLTLPLTVERGIGVLRTPVKDLKPGRFTFRSPKRADDACGNPPGLPIVTAPPDWQTETSDHFTYRWLPGDPVGNRMGEVLTTLEQRRAAIVTASGLEDSATVVTFLHYRDRDTGLAFQAHHGNNVDWSRNLVFSAEAEDDTHELTHLLFSRDVGRHVGLFDEGVAIHFGQEIATGSGWRNRPCDDWARESIAAGELPPLQQLLTPAQMYAAPWAQVGTHYYPAGCSFVGFLVGRFGAPRLRLFLRSYDCESQHDADQVSAAFKRTFGVALDAADRDWRKGLSAPR